MPAGRTILENVAAEMFPSAAEISHLGTGGFACTFRVVDSGETFALKLLDPGTLEADRLERELAALQRVNHAGVVKFLDHGEFSFGGVVYHWIKMAFVGGTPLADEFAGGVVYTPLEAIRLLRDLVAAATAIWEQRTAHRDLSPRNILITPDGSPVIVDLGLARHIDDETITVLPTPGTPGWMSPEQVSAASHGDWRSDQFVLGALCYRFLTSNSPFWDPNLMDRWMMPLNHEQPPVRGVDPDVPSIAADIVDRMLQKQPHRRYLKAADLLADIDRALTALKTTQVPEERQPQFLVHIGQVKNWAENGFLPRLRPQTAVIDIRAADRIEEFTKAMHVAAGHAALDPATHYLRSPLEFRPAQIKSLPWGEDPKLTAGFNSNESRAYWCRRVFDHQKSYGPDVVISPYFYAAESEMNWIAESLACASVYEEMADSADPRPEVWTGVAVHQSWLANPVARDVLLTALTGQPMAGLYLLVATAQPAFAPIADANVLLGLRDLIAVMREAGVPVIVGKRASSGLLLLALGADAWASGITANLMNSAPHPEAKIDGRKATDRIYVPQLLNLLAVETYVLWSAQQPEVLALDSEPLRALLATNPSLETLSTDDRVLLLQHNLMAQKGQVDHLAALPAGQRVARMRTWVDNAEEIYARFPQPRLSSERSGFLSAWASVLS